jgi:TRAP-type C4-dicarboxylate transport system substrate-binding protein
MSKKTFTRRAALKTGAAAVTAGAVITGFPALTRSAQQKKFLKPIVAGLNGKEGDPSYTSVSDVPRILAEKYDIEVDFQIHPSSYGRIAKAPVWQQQAAKFEQGVGVKVLPPVGAGGYRLFWNNLRQTKTPADAAGLKIRSVQSPIVIEMLRSWGCNPTPVPWVETYTALQQGVADGFHVQPIWTFKFKMYEVLKYATEVNAIFGIQFQVMNINTWNAIPESIQGPMMMAFQEAADAANVRDREGEDFYKDELRKVGMEIYTPTKKEFAQWQEAARSVWGSAGKDIDKSVIDQIIALS